MISTKICGLTREADRDAAISAGADMVGFVCDVPIETPRELSPTRAAELIERVPASVTSVLVTMPATPTAGADLVKKIDPDAVQVHGCSTDEVEALGERTGKPILAGVDAADDRLKRYAAVADALVLDSTDENGAGGTGETHDWKAARSVVADLDVPVLLAGGLTPENVAAAVRTVEPFGVDVSSGIEREPGETASPSRWTCERTASPPVSRQSERDARREAKRNDGVEEVGGVKNHEALRRFLEHATGVQTVSA